MLTTTNINTITRTGTYMELQLDDAMIINPAEIVVVTTTIEYNSDWIRHQTLGISDGQ